MTADRLLSAPRDVRRPMPSLPPARLLAEVDRSGLLGRGGAGFPLSRKLSAVAGGSGPRVVVANAAEGEPASAKDKALLDLNPHLVLDGLQLAASAVGAGEAYLYVEAAPSRSARLHRVLAERRHAGRELVGVRLVESQRRFVAGEETAVVDRLNGGAGRPRPKPPRVSESGVDGRPTLVSNAETLAHLAVIAGCGADEFLRHGVPQHAGTMLFTVSGAVRDPGVVEAPVGISLGDLLELRGGHTEEPAAVLVGGYHGGWLPWPQARDVELSNPALASYGLAVGAGVVVVLPASACGVAETLAVMTYLATETAGQCGPCVFGLSQLVTTLRHVASGRMARRNRRQLDDLAQGLVRRGACAHPDGSLRFLRTSLAVFEGEFAAHARGRCTAARSGARPGARLLPTPGVTG